MTTTTNGTTPAPTTSAPTAIDKSPPTGWCWAAWRDAEDWNGPFDSREEAIAEARNAVQDTGPIFVCAGRSLEPSDLCLRGAAESVWERAVEQAEVHENVADWLSDEPTKEEFAALDALIAEWARPILVRVKFVHIDQRKAEEVTCG